MYAFIHNERIMGFTHNPNIKPAGWRVEPSPSNDREDLYWHREDEEVKVKPNQPTPKHRWNEETYTWELREFINLPIPQQQRAASEAVIVRALQSIRQQEPVLGDILIILVADILNRPQQAQAALSRLRNAFPNGN